MPELKQDLQAGTWRDPSKPADGIDITPYESTITFGEKDTGQWVVERRAHNRYMKDPVEWHTSRTAKKGEREIMDLTNNQCWTECQMVDEHVVKKRVLTLQYVEWWRINITLQEYFTYRGISKAAVGTGGGLGLMFVPAGVVAAGVASVGIGTFMITSAVMKHLGPSSEVLITGGWEIVQPEEPWGPEVIEKQSTPRWERCSEARPCKPPKKQPTGGGAGAGKQIGMGTKIGVGLGLAAGILGGTLAYNMVKDDDPKPVTDSPVVAGVPKEEQPQLVEAPRAEFVVCSGTAHDGAVPGFPSRDILGVYGTDPSSEVEATHAGETQTDELGPDRIALFDFGISAYDAYPWSISSGGEQIAKGNLVVDADQTACDEQVLEAEAKQAGIFGTGGITPEAAVTAFVMDLAGAFQRGDAAFVFGHLDPAVIDVYGGDQCRAHAASVSGLPPDPKVTDVSGPSTYTYNPDGLSIPVDGVFSVAFTGQGSGGTIHIGGQPDAFTWFTDCGTPQAP